MDFSETITKQLEITQLELPVAIFRVSELSQSGHLLKADNVGIGNGSGHTVEVALLNSRFHVTSGKSLIKIVGNISLTRKIVHFLCTLKNAAKNFSIP